MTRKYPYWQNVERDDYDKERGYWLCPHCHNSLEHQIDLDNEGEETIIRERCTNGCYVFNFQTMTKE